MREPVIIDVTDADRPVDPAKGDLGVIDRGCDIHSCGSCGNCGGACLSLSSLGDGGEGLSPNWTGLALSGSETAAKSTLAGEAAGCKGWFLGPLCGMLELYCACDNSIEDSGEGKSFRAAHNVAAEKSAMATCLRHASLSPRCSLSTVSSFIGSP